MTLQEKIKKALETPMPDSHDDFTPEIALKIINLYRQLLAEVLNELNDQ